MAAGGHEPVVAPPELHLGQLARKLYWVHGHTAGLIAEATDQYRNEASRAHVRNDINRIINAYAAQQGKQSWCEKSVSTIDDIDVIHPTWPGAKYICLHRECLDHVASSSPETLERPDRLLMEHQAQ